MKNPTYRRELKDVKVGGESSVFEQKTIVHWYVYPVILDREEDSQGGQHHRALEGGDIQ